MATSVVKTIIVSNRVVVWLCAILLFLLLAHAAGLVMTYGFGHPTVKGLVPFFNIAGEQNLSAFFATFLLLANAGLFLFIWHVVSSTEDRGKGVWLLLSFTFCFLAIDEFVELHEELIVPTRNALGTGGYLHFAWVIPYSIAVALMAVIVAPAVWALGNRFRVLFGLAAVTYLSGAIGVEMLGGNYFGARDEVADLNYRLFQMVEESLEFCGLIILVYTLLELIRTRYPGTSVEIRFSQRSQPGDAECIDDA